MNIQFENKKIHKLPIFEKLPPYWKSYFLDNDNVIQENFWGNLSILKKVDQQNDPYIRQLKEMGYCFNPGSEHPAPFFDSIKWVFDNISFMIEQGVLGVSDVLWPARVFLLNNTDAKEHYAIRVVGEDIPEHSEELHLISPDLFVEMLGKGYFPIGGHIREHTNQSLAEHDLAHFAGFICSPEYMSALRESFRIVTEKMHNNPRVKQALQSFNSIYSLRLYYMTEVFTLIPESKKKKLQELVEMDIASPLCFDKIIAILEKKAKDPASLYQYLHRIYDQFYEVVEPVGGESRDILNRVRKFNRSNHLGIFYSQRDVLDSKFDGSSIYSMYFNGCAALENKRSTHPDFLTALREIHAPFIGALVGTSQLKMKDWVMAAAEEIPDKNSKLYKYLCDSKMWNESHLIYRAYGCDDYAKIDGKQEKQRELYE